MRSSMVQSSGAIFSVLADMDLLFYSQMNALFADDLVPSGLRKAKRASLQSSTAHASTVCSSERIVRGSTAPSCSANFAKRAPGSDEPWMRACPRQLYLPTLQPSSAHTPPAR